MRALIRIVNAFYAALFVLGALVSLLFLIAATDGLARGPEALWRTTGGAAAAALLACLCVANMRGARMRPVAAANIAALVLLAAGLLAAEPALGWIAGLSLPPFALALLGYRKNPA
jgi:hypothetical protein